MNAYVINPRKFCSLADTALHIEAIQWQGELHPEWWDKAAALVAPYTLHSLNIGTRSAFATETRILYADPDFPCWIERGEWITRDRDGEVNVWTDAVFRESFFQVQDGGRAL